MRKFGFGFDRTDIHIKKRMNLRNSTFSVPLRMVSNIRNNVSEKQISQLQEEIILVNEEDKVLGPASKKVAHSRNGNNSQGLLHRAFSVFLFNSNNELLIQQRSSAKITFPDYFTNTCCSHQRYNDEEMQLENYFGTRLAAKRRMSYELGIELPVDSYQMLTRIHYWSPADDHWTEHELDHVLICKADINLSNVNTDEVQKTIFLNQNDLKDFLSKAKKENVLITPWFRYICNNFLYTWWDNLDTIEKFQNDKIHNAGYQSPT